jgi:hypothetical protein
MNEYDDQYAKWLEDAEASLDYIGMGVMPVHTKDSMSRYLLHGMPPGGFLTSCLVGDLFAACQMADTANSRNLHAIAQWIMHYAPPECYGSVQKVEAWLADHNAVRSSYVSWLKKKEVWHLMLNTR